MHLKSFRRWIQQVYATQDEELDCGQFFDAIAQYVDIEVAGDEASECFPDVKQHMDECADCYDLYVTVRDAAFLEREQVVSELAID
jgi:predicted anti-sigma-YlaC factor YlaD